MKTNLVRKLKSNAIPVAPVSIIALKEKTTQTNVESMDSTIGCQIVVAIIGKKPVTALAGHSGGKNGEIQ